MTVKTSGIAEGFFLQQTRFLVHLLRGEPGTFVSLEELSDVASHKEDGSIVAEEDKSGLTYNPVVDHSRDLWKTFSNWSKAAQNGTLNPLRTEFIIFVPHDYTGNFVQSFSDATNEEGAKNALNTVRDELWGKSPSYDKKETVAESISGYVEDVLDENNPHMLNIIMHFSLETGTDGSYDAIEQLLSTRFVQDEFLDVLEKQLLGWVKTCIDECINAKEVVRISVEEMQKEAKTFLRTLDHNHILASFAGNPTEEKKLGEYQQPKNYVQQLRLIDTKYEDILSAISDYLKANVDRHAWITRGMVHPLSLLTFSNTLTRIWKNIAENHQITSSNQSDVDIGKLIYNGCSDRNVKIEGRELPFHMVPGSYHVLSDEKRVGWHPKWQTLLN